jgi:hypothetical protein
VDAKKALTHNRAETLPTRVKPFISLVLRLYEAHMLMGWVLVEVRWSGRTGSRRHQNGRASLYPRSNTPRSPVASRR